MKHAVHVVPFKAPPFLPLPSLPPSLPALPNQAACSLSPLRFCVVCLRLVTFVLDSELNEDIIRMKNQREREAVSAAGKREREERRIENRTQ